MRRSQLFTLLLIVPFFLGTLTGCSLKKHPHDKPDTSPKACPVNLDKVPNAVPKVEPLSRYGNRFKKGNSYVTKNKRYTVMSTSKGYRAEGRASWYGTKFHGRKTSSGEIYNMYAMTAAHRTLPLPTYAKVTNLDNGKQVIVKINDRGPFHKDRLLDLSYAAAHKLGITAKGTGKVEILSIDPRDHQGRVPKDTMKVPSTKNKSILETSKNNTQTAKTEKSRPKQLYLQLGNFEEKRNAEALMNKAAKLSSQTMNINEGWKGARPAFSVRIGPIKSQQEAILLTQKLGRSKLPTPVVIRE